MSRATERLSSYQYSFLAIAAVGQFFLAGDWYSFAAMIPFVSGDLKLTPSEAGLAQGAFAITYAVGIFLWSPLGHRMTSRSLYAIGLLGCGVAIGIMSLANDLTQLLAARLAIGFFDAAVWVGAMKLVVQWFPMRSQGKAMGVLLAAFSLAITADFAVGIPMALSLGWRQFFVMLGVLTMGAGILGLLVIKESPASVGIDAVFEDPDHVPLRGNGVVSRVLRARGFYIGFLGIFGGVFAISAAATWVVPAWVAVQNMPVAYGAMIGTIMGLSQVAFVLFGGWLADHYPRPDVMRVGAVLCVLIAFALLVTMAVPVSLGWLLAAALVSGLAVLSGGASFSSISENVGRDLAATAIGYAEFGAILATFLAPTAMGLMVDVAGSFLAAFCLFVLVELAVAMALFVALRGASRRVALVDETR